MAQQLTAREAWTKLGEAWEKAVNCCGDFQALWTEGGVASYCGATIPETMSWIIHHGYISSDTYAAMCLSYNQVDPEVSYGYAKEAVDAQARAAFCRLEAKEAPSVVTEKEAWAFLAEKWERAVKVDDHQWGIRLGCQSPASLIFSLEAMLGEPNLTASITPQTRDEMRRKIYNRVSGPAWSSGEASAASRAQFCRDQVQQLEAEERKMQPEKKLLNEQEAWSWLADAWEMRHGEICDDRPDHIWGIRLYGERYEGLCSCIEELQDGRRFPVRIDQTTRDMMISKIAVRGVGMFKWPRTEQGAKQRAAFCRANAMLVQPSKAEASEDKACEKAPEKAPEARELSEKEAWYWLAEKWQNAISRTSVIPGVKVGNSFVTCLCDTLGHLASGDDESVKISPATRRLMADKIAALPHDEDELFCWPRTLEGAKQRAEFCLAEAKKMEPTSVYPEWVVVFPGKMGVCWKRHSHVPDGLNEEQARKEAARFCNTVAIPKALFDHLKEVEAERTRVQVLLGNLRGELRRAKETHDGIADIFLRGTNFSEAMKAKLDSCLRNLDDHYTHKKG